MQEERLRLRAMRVGALPILNAFIERMGLEEELALALKSAGYADALLALVKNILVDRNALDAMREWAELFQPGLLARNKVNDDKLGRALDRLFAADRATLRTRIVLAVMNSFDLKMEQIHNDTTSVMVRGAYDVPRPFSSSKGTAKSAVPISSSWSIVFASQATAPCLCTSRPTTATRPTMGSIWRRGVASAPCCH